MASVCKSTVYKRGTQVALRNSLQHFFHIYGFNLEQNLVSGVQLLGGLKLVGVEH